MPLDWVEYEIRRLPGVIAAGVDDRAITVLVLPDIDADAVRVMISAMLAAAGAEVSVRVIGGAASPEIRRRAIPIAAGSVAGFGVLATAAVAVGLTGGIPWVPQAPPPPAQSASAPVAPAHREDPWDTGGAVVVPGPLPAWASAEGPWPLPASLPPAQTVVLSTPAPVSIDITARDPEPATATPQPASAAEKTPASSSTFEPSRTAGAAVSFAPVEYDEGDESGANDSNERGRGRKRSVKGNHANGRHRGWVEGPAHANSRSSASEAPRGGR